MIRNLKVLGLALVAVLAMSAVAASMASADAFTSEKSPVLLTGKQIAPGDVFTTTAGTVKCKEVSYKATTGTPTTTISATPTYPAKTASGEQNCTGFGFPAEVTTNGCTYLFHLGAATTGTLDIVCPAEKEITVTAVSAGTDKCIVHVPAQVGLATITYRNSGGSLSTRELEVEANIGGLTYTHTEGTGIGRCTPGHSATGTYTGKAIVTGEEDGSPFAHVGIFLS